MAEEKWNVGRFQDICFACRKKILTGEELISALVFTGVDFERRDFCASCFEDVRKEDLYSHWHTKVPAEEEKPRPKTVSVHVLVDLFQQLFEEKDPAKEGLTFLLGMILVQKRVLKYLEVRAEKGKRIIVLGRPRSKTNYSLVDPGMEAEKMDAMREELKKVLELET